MEDKNVPIYLKVENEEQVRKQSGSDSLITEAPDTLSEVGRLHYYYIVRELLKRDIIVNLDIPILGQISDCLEKMDICDQILNEEGLFIEARDSRGNKIFKEHPAINTKQKYMNQFKYIVAQLGMSPASRASMAMTTGGETKANETNPLNKLMEMKNKNRENNNNVG